MFVAIPLEAKPSWRSPPWMTVLLILINCLIYWGWQVPEERAVPKAAERYAATDLPKLELPHFVQHLKTQTERGAKGEAGRALDRLYADGQYAELYRYMWQEKTFRQRLLNEQVITPQSPDYAAWKTARAAFTPTEPKPFTERWAMSYQDGAGWQPVQAVTAMFLHGSTGHLLGNMVMLFLFGFTLEMALGAFTYLAMYLIGGVCASWFALLFYAGTGSYGLGASGAIAALMGMYVVMYRMRRIRFFYILGPYFNYATWPALVLLPVWLAFEGVQHLMGGGHVAYMAHFGGLVAGAGLMAAYMAIKQVQAPVNQAQAQADAAQPLQDAIARAQRYTDALQFDRATPAWRAAAKLAPSDPKVLQAWFDCARHTPGGDDFHAAARRIFKLNARDSAICQLQHRSYRIYADKAQPGPRISVDTLHGLVRSFVRVEAFADAERLCQALQASAEHPQWSATLSLMVNGLSRSGRVEQARQWLPELDAHAPHEPVTSWLKRQS